jgi:hypothetical protein
VLAGLAGLVLVLVGLPGGGGGDRSVVVPGVDEATAAGRMAARMAWAMANAQSLHAQFRQEEEGVATVQGEFWMTYRGDYRIEALLEQNPEISGSLDQSVEYIFIYNARQHACQLQSGDGEAAMTLSEGAWGPVAPFPLYFSYLSYKFQAPEFNMYEAYAAAVRGLVAGEYEGVSVEETTYEGRPAWRAELPIFALGPEGGYGERSPEEAVATPALIAGLTVTIDQETGLMVRLERAWRLRDVPAPMEWGPFVLELSDLEVDEDIPDSLFRLSEDEEAGRGYSVFEEPAQVAQETGYALLLPSRLPDGFELTDSSWTLYGPPGSNDAFSLWVSWGALAMGGARPIDPSDEVAPEYAGKVVTEVTLQYRRGLDWVLIRQMPTGRVTSGDHNELDDRYVQELVAPHVRWGYEQREVADGSLAGKTAHTWLTNFGGRVEHLQGPGVFVWGATEDEFSYLIMGTLTREELVDIANSMEPLGD